MEQWFHLDRPDLITAHFFGFKIFRRAIGILLLFTSSAFAQTSYFLSRLGYSDAEHTGLNNYRFSQANVFKATSSTAPRNATTAMASFPDRRNSACERDLIPDSANLLDCEVSPLN